MRPPALFGVRPCRWVKDDDLSDVGGEEESVHEDPLAQGEGRLHRTAGNLVRLDREGLDRESEANGHRNGQRELEQPLGVLGDHG